MNKCDSEYVTNAEVCLSADYAGAACNPSVTPTPTPITPTPTPITPTPITPTPITPTPITPTPSSTDCKQITADGKTYYGTVASGFTSEQVVAGADKLLSLFGIHELKSTLVST